MSEQQKVYLLRCMAGSNEHEVHCSLHTYLRDAMDFQKRETPESHLKQDGARNIWEFSNINPGVLEFRTGYCGNIVWSIKEMPVYSEPVPEGLPGSLRNPIEKLEYTGNPERPFLSPRTGAWCKCNTCGTVERACDLSFCVDIHDKAYGGTLYCYQCINAALERS